MTGSVATCLKFHNVFFFYIEGTNVKCPCACHDAILSTHQKISACGQSYLPTTLLQEEGIHNIHWIGCWLGPMANVGTLERESPLHMAWTWFLDFIPCSLVTKLTRALTCLAPELPYIHHKKRDIYHLSTIKRGHLLCTQKMLKKTKITYRM
jgi:hypothetical protein